MNRKISDFKIQEYTIRDGEPPPRRRRYDGFFTSLAAKMQPGQWVEVDSQTAANTMTAYWRKRGEQGALRKLGPKKWGVYRVR